MINDPDCRLYLISHIDEMVDESLQEMAKYEKFMNETRYMPMLRQSRVLCKSEVPDSHLMWSHYSDFHKGVVLELGTSDPDSAWNGSRQVLYSDRSVIGFDNTRWIDYFCSVGPPPPGDSFADAHLLTKHNDWAYEKEWRTFWKGDADVPGIMDIPYEPHEIDAVYFGIRCSKQIRSDLMNKAAQSGIKPRYFSATFDEYRHSLVFEPYE
ncbi:MAG: DUF2971 domain-containing protein [Phycisphaerales bacterium]|nr:DUF2971 domain-containing protein [Phycisphaerales bacterium]